MKGVFVILDGMGDLPNKQLDEKTPLEAAETPNLDFFAARGEMGYMYSVRPNFIPESDEAIVSIFGNELLSSTRGQLEARGAGIKLTRGDLALRVNFVTIDSLEKGNILDRRAGRNLSTTEALALSKELNKIKLPCDFVFKPTVQHRAVLVLRGGFSDNICGNDMTYEKGRKESEKKIIPVKPMDDDENSQYTANVLNEFLERAYEVLSRHSINKTRKEKGWMPANYLLVRGAGIEPPKLKQYKRWFSVAYMPVELGFSMTSGMKTVTFEYPKFKKRDAYANLYDGLSVACRSSIKALKKNYKKFDYAYLHIKETDVPGHDNKPFEKKAMIEYIDKTLINFLRKFAPSRKIKVVVTADHATPCKLKSHSADPVPVLFYPAGDTVPKEKKFSEKEARKGEMKRMVGHEVLKKTGFVK